MMKIGCYSPQTSGVAVHSLPRKLGGFFVPALPWPQLPTSLLRAVPRVGEACQGFLGAGERSVRAREMACGGGDTGKPQFAGMVLEVGGWTGSPAVRGSAARNLLRAPAANSWNVHGNTALGAALLQVSQLPLAPGPGLILHPACCREGALPHTTEI